MKKSIFYIAIVFLFSVLVTSCTTDSYDKEMEDSSVIQSDDTTSDSTDPIVIPKRD